MQGGLSLKTKLHQYSDTRDDAFLPDAAAPKGFFGGDADANPKQAAFRKFWDGTIAGMYRMEQGLESADNVVKSIYDGLRDGEFVPAHFQMHNPDRRYAKIVIP